MRLKQYLVEQHSCPFRSHMFGGIPGGGGFEANTEWEIGGQRLAEAAHCIIGSLVKMVDSKYKIDNELGHIDEELGIIEREQKEYGRDWYTNDLEKRLEDGNEWGIKTINSIKKNAPRLEKIASKAKDNLGKDIPAPIRDVGVNSYWYLIALAKVFLDAIRGADKPPVYIKNPYKHIYLVNAKKNLIDKINVLRKYKGKTYEEIKNEV